MTPYATIAAVLIALGGAAGEPAPPAAERATPQARLAVREAAAAPAPTPVQAPTSPGRGATVQQGPANPIAAGGPALGLQQQTVTSFDIDSPVARLVQPARQAVTLREGEPYNVAEMHRTLQNIYALGNVSDVQVRAADGGGGGLRLTFVVLPATHLHEIQFAGDSPVGRGPLRDAVRIRPGDRLDRDLVAQQAERVQLALADRGYMTARVEPEIAFDADGDAGNVIFHLYPGTPTRLERLELQIDGDLDVPDAELKRLLGISEGGVFRNLDLETGFERLRRALAESHYFFAAVSIAEQAINQSANTVDLTVGIDAGPRVRLDIRGLDRTEEELHEVLPFWEENSVADWVLKQGRQDLLGWLQGRGHWRPLVTYSRQRDERGRNVAVAFTVIPGPEATVEQVVFEGNDSIPDDELRRVVGTREGGLLRGRKFLSAQWLRDQDAVRNLYRRRGFPDTGIVEAPVRNDPEAGGLVATMRIEEGSQVLVEAIDLNVVSGVPTIGIDPTVWRQQLALQEDGPYDPSRLREDESRLRILMANSGYPRGAVSAEAELDREAGSARVVFRLQPGRRARVSRVLVAGNKKTRDDVILRELALVPGSPYTYEGLVETQSRLYRLGLFSRVEITPSRPDSIDTERTVVVRVEEGPHRRLSWGFGYDSEEGPRGLTTFGNDNLWGMNRQGSISLRASFREQRLRAVLTEPYLFGRWLRASTSAFYESVQEEGFDVERTGGAFQVLKRHSEPLTSLARYNFRRVRTFNLEIDPAELDLEDRAVIIGSVTYSLIRDTRPDPIDPRSGTYHTVDVELASELMGSESDFVRLFGRSHWYWELGDLVLAAAGRAGIAFPFAGDDDLPLPERFFTGGSSSLRAFRLNAAGPTDENGNPLGGEVLLLGNLELRFPVHGNLGGVLFLDAGNVFTDLEGVRLSEVREVLGIGARYATPIGPARVDWGHLLDRRAGESGWRFYVSVGHTF